MSLVYEQELGPLVSEHRQSPKAVRAELLVAVALVVVALPFVWVIERYTPPSIVGTVITWGTTAILVGFAMWLAGRAIQDRDLRLALYERGLVYVRRGVTTWLRYDAVVELLSELTVERTHLGEGKTWCVDRHTLSTVEGLRCELRCSFDDNDAVLHALHRATAHLVAHARRELAAGQRVVLGSLTLTPNGIVKAGELFAWRELTAVELVVDRHGEDSSADIVLRCGARSATTGLGDVPNAHALLAVARAAGVGPTGEGWS